MSQQVEPQLLPITYSDKENVEMWKTLDKKDKANLYKIALDRFRYLGEHFKYQGVRMGDDNFTDTSCFKLMMELIGRRPEKRTILPKVADTNSL